MMPGRENKADPRGAQDRARQERLDVLSGIRGDKAEHALRHGDLDGVVAELVQRMLIAELNKRGL